MRAESVNTDCFYYCIYINPFKLLDHFTSWPHCSPDQVIGGTDAIIFRATGQHTGKTKRGHRARPNLHLEAEVK